MTLTAGEVHAFQHTLIVQRLRALLDDDLKGRKLVIARDLLAYTILGHDRLYPDCRLTGKTGPTTNPEVSDDDRPAVPDP